MWSGHLLVLLFSTQLCWTAAIRCDFQYSEDENVNGQNGGRTTSKAISSNKIVTTSVTRTSSKTSIPLVLVYTPTSSKEFQCDENISEDDSRVFLRSGFDDDIDEGDDDPYENVESSCTSRKWTLTPFTMNNVLNKKVSVLQNATFVQKINAEQCISKTSLSSSFEECNVGHTTSATQKNICRNVYVQVTLKAVNSTSTFDEKFYYPTNCVCGLFNIQSNKADDKI